MRTEVYIIVNNKKNSIWMTNDGLVEHSSILGAQKILACIPEQKKGGYRVEKLFKFRNNPETGRKSDHEIEELVRNLKS